MYPGTNQIRVNAGIQMEQNMFNQSTNFCKELFFETGWCITQAYKQNIEENIRKYLHYIHISKHYYITQQISGEIFAYHVLRVNNIVQIFNSASSSCEHPVKLHPCLVLLESIKLSAVLLNF